MAVTNADVYDKTYEWYTSGPRQRLQPGGSIVVIATRWSKRDLTGRLLQRMEEEHSDDWEVIEFPAILPSGNALWPEFWPLDELLAVKASLPVAKWNAQYQQNPTSDENAIIKREWWKIWEHPDPPKCEFVIQTWDTAHTAKRRSDYSACTTWGVFRTSSDTEQRNIILLNAFSKKLEFPDLKTRAKEEWKQWNPDALLIEAKAAGWPLIQELREMGIPVQDYSPSRGEDKFIRLNAMSDMFRSGMVWVPPYRWAEELIEQVADFPNGDHDDLVDCCSLAGMRFRQGGFLRLPSDEADEKRASRQVIEYY